VIYRLRPKEGPADGHLVTIGRDSRHDAVVPDPSVSRLHCIAKREADGSWCLQDMRSSNGTMINSRSVPARGAGDPAPVKPGDTVQFGQVQFTFTDAATLRDIALKAAR
jgi:pSer/pThr/pTyr-binding forkhead associated (FHA) protein